MFNKIMVLTGRWFSAFLVVVAVSIMLSSCQFRDVNPSWPGGPSPLGDDSNLRFQVIPTTQLVPLVESGILALKEVPETKLNQILSAYCETHSWSAQDLVIGEIGTGTFNADGSVENAVLWTEKLDVVARYSLCFEQIYLGTSHVKYDGDKYLVGFRDDTYRNKVANLTRVLARKLKTWLEGHPSQLSEKMHWYLMEEYSLNLMANDTYAQGFIATNLGIAEAMNSVIRDRDFLWSPIFFRKPSRVSEEHVAALLKHLNDMVDSMPGSGEFHLHFQDRLGRVYYDPPESRLKMAFPAKIYGNDQEIYTCENHVKPWFEVLQNGIGDRVKIKINAELFALKRERRLNEMGAPLESAGGYLLGGLFPELVDRIKCYQKNQLAVGAACNLNLWYLSQTYPFQYSVGYLDLYKEHYSSTAVAWATNFGLEIACQNHPRLFCPELAIQRGEIPRLALQAYFGTKYVPEYIVPHFQDVSSPESIWADDFYYKGFTSGCGANRYCPQKNILRKNAAVFLARLCHGPDFTPGPISTDFGLKDLPIDSSRPYILQMYKDGLVEGCTRDKFCPEEILTRAQFVTFLYRIHKSRGTTCQQFSY